MNQTELFLRDLKKGMPGELPENLKLRLQLALLDYLGVTFAGVEANGEKLSKLIDMTERGETPAIGIAKRMAMENAIFLNGLNAHTLDFDDGTNTGIIHLGSPVFSALLPLAARHDIPVGKFLKAALVGYESAFTMAVSIQPRHKNRGYHATGTCGTLGATLSIAELLEFDDRQRKAAFSAAAVSASGMLKVLDDGSALKPYNVGKAALMGYTAAKMGLVGYKGPDDVLAGERGFFSMMYGDAAVQLQPIRLAGTFALEKAYIKPYAACRYCHPSIEAALTIRKKHGVEAAQIESITVRTYSLAVYKHDHTEIAGSGSAKMSIPYSVAVAVCKGEAGVSQFEGDILTDFDVLDLTKKVTVLADEEMSANFPAKQTAVVEIRIKSGAVYSEQVDFPKGEPENPMSPEEVGEKFLSLMLYGGRSRNGAEKVLAAVMDIENQFAELLDLIADAQI